MTRHLKKTGTQITVLGKLIERARREHKLTTATLAMLSGLSDAQIKGIEHGNAAAFVDDAHRIDCARRIALAMGLPENNFLETHAATTSAQRIIPEKARPPGPEQLSRDVWEDLPVAGLKVLATLRATDYPSAPEQRRSGSPLRIALMACLVLSVLMLGVTFLR